MQITRIAVLSLVLSLLSPVALAETVSAKGTAAVSYSRYDETVKQDAIQKARINALDRYFAEGKDISKQDNYSQIRDSIVGNVNDYVLGEYVLSEDLDKKGKIYNIVLRVEINGNKLENALRASSVTANTARGEKNAITFIFVAREQTSVQSFDDKVFKRRDSHASDEAMVDTTDNSNEGERVSRGSVKLTGSSNASQKVVADSSVSMTSGGSKTRKRNAVEWEVSESNDITRAVTGVLNRAKFKVSPPGPIERKSGGLLNINAIRQDYSKGAISDRNQTNAALAAKAAGMGYIAFGTVDIGMQDTDPATGNVRVAAKVTAFVLDLSEEDPFEVASVGPISEAGLGVDESEARTAALQRAADAAAQQLVNDLNAQSVK